MLYFYVFSFDLISIVDPTSMEWSRMTLSLQKIVFTLLISLSCTPLQAAGEITFEALVFNGSESFENPDVFHFN